MFNASHPVHKQILFITGCQRSGTTMMTRLFERDIHSMVYGEFSEISSVDRNNIRLDPLDKVKAHFIREKANFIVAKPLVESQNIKEILDYFPGSRAIWMYRHFQDVASSNLINFGESNGVRDINFIVENNPANWRAEKNSKEALQVINRLYDPAMGHYDAAALFWFARNRLYFDLHLDQDERIMPVKYEALVKSPEKIMREIYEFVQVKYPGDKILSEVSSRSVGKGETISISPQIQQVCDQLYHKLEHHYQDYQAINNQQNG